MSGSLADLLHFVTVSRTASQTFLIIHIFSKANQLSSPRLQNWAELQRSRNPLHPAPPAKGFCREHQRLGWGDTAPLPAPPQPPQAPEPALQAAERCQVMAHDLGQSCSWGWSEKCWGLRGWSEGCRGGSGAGASSDPLSAACGQAAVGLMPWGGLVTLRPTLVFPSPATTGAVNGQLLQGWWL